MSGMTSLAIATSGLKAAQMGLSVTGHNMSNVYTPGYTRQRTEQVDFKYMRIGNDRNGVTSLGLGADVVAIKQLRNEFLDASYRREVTRLGFYESKVYAGLEIETIIGELQSDYKMQSIVSDLWDSLNQLSLYQPGLESRGVFISTAVTFLDKAQNAYKRMVDYQNNLNEQIKSSVYRINSLVEEINMYNNKISDAEMNGDRANDYRDSRNNCIDELSKLIRIDVKESPRGIVNIMSEGNELLMNGVINKMGLRYTAEDYAFVEPIFTKEQGILPWDTPASDYRPVFNYSETINSENGSDAGLLKGLLYTRGMSPANYTASLPNVATTDPRYALYKAISDAKTPDQNFIDDFNINKAFIPKVQWQLDTIVHSIVTLINDAIAPVQNGVPDPNGPYDLNNNRSFTELFKRLQYDRFGMDANGNATAPYQSEYRLRANGTLDMKALYSIVNLEINPKLLDSVNGGYNLLCLSPKEGELENTELVLSILAKWKDVKAMPIQFGDSSAMTVDEAYKAFVNNTATETSEAENFCAAQAELVSQAQTKKEKMSGVSLDEEMTNMMKYQHAYNAAARILNVIDSMIDKVVNGTGRAGR